MSKVLRKRRAIREKAIQTLFQLINPPEHLSQDDAIAFALEAGNYPDEGYDKVEGDYLYHLINGVQENQEEIDQKIQSYLKDWTLESIAKIDLVVLRLAFYEFFYVDNQVVPQAVAVDEGIEMAKAFSNDQSRQFVSGVLLKLLNDNKESETSD